MEPAHIQEAVQSLQPEAIHLLRELVRIPSITGEEAEAQFFLAGYLRQMKLEVDLWYPQRDSLLHHPAFSDDGLPLGERPVLAARFPGTSGTKRSLILNGHMDVVPTGDPEAWLDDPWSGAYRDGRIFGRGSCDMKGGLVAGVIAILGIQRLGVQPSAEVVLQSVIGEETGGVGTLSAVLRGYRADAAVILEPTQLALCPIGSGAASFRLRIPGRATHGALREEGVSAVEKFIPMFQALLDLEQSRHSGFHHPLFRSGLAAPISIGKVAAGDWPSTVPDGLVAEGRYGVFPGESMAEARSMFEQAVKTAADRDPWLCENPVEVEWFEGQFEPAYTPADARVVREIAAAHHDLYGAQPDLHGVPYGSDLRFFTNYAGMQALLYGPGDVRLAHSVNESVPINEVLQAAAVIALTITRWSERSASGIP